jgi:hypothetical protein
MTGKAILGLLLIGLVSLPISIDLLAQPCPELKLNPSASSQSYLEIQSPEGESQIPLPHIMVFPEGQERIYCLLPDLVTSQNTPIIQWNELVLKKGLNTEDNWQGTIDRVIFFQTPCLPELKPSHFTNASSEPDFYYDSRSNVVSIKGTVSFASTDGVTLKLHLNIENQEIPKPQINSLKGELFSPNGELEIISGEISFEKNESILRGSGIASSNAQNQGFEFSIPKYKGKAGIYAVNEGTDANPYYSIFSVDGDPADSLEIKKYELQATDINFKSFYDKFPFLKDSIALENLKLRSRMASNSIAIDPKPEPEVMPLFNTAFDGMLIGIEQLKQIANGSVKGPESWEENLAVKMSNYPLWDIQIEEDLDEANQKILTIHNTPAVVGAKDPAQPTLSMEQVTAMNEGFSSIFKSFDENSDTLSLKKSILLLFSKNILPTSASINDDFEDFLVTTVTEFREAEKQALENSSSMAGTINFNANQNLSYTLYLDEKAKFPRERRFEINETNIQIHYGDTITIQAENAMQGKETLFIPGNPEIFDIYQFYGVIKHLPLAPGFKTNLGFFDVQVQPQKLQTGTQSIGRQLLTPYFIHVSVSVEEEIIFENQSAYKVNIQFQGLNNSLFVESYQNEDAGEYYLSKPSPHQLIQATFDEGIVLEKQQ